MHCKSNWDFFSEAPAERVGESQTKVLDNEGNRIAGFGILKETGFKKNRTEVVVVLGQLYAPELLDVLRLLFPPFSDLVRHDYSAKTLNAIPVFMCPSISASIKYGTHKIDNPWGAT